MERLLLIALCYFIIINRTSSEQKGPPGKVKEYLHYEEGEVGRGIDGGISCAACSVLLVN